MPSLASSTQGPMPHSAELERLAAEWSTEGSPTVFAALADGLHKRGAVAEAWQVVMDGVARYPAFVPGRLMQARLLEERGEGDAALAALDAARAQDPSHPLLREGAAAEAPGETEAASEEVHGAALLDADSAPAALLSESLAALYHRQGHLEQAAAAYAALSERDPASEHFAARRAAIEAELAARRPLPFRASEADGQSVREWLGGVAHAAPTDHPRREGFDAFYQAPPAPAEATADFAAFQRWLEELGR